MAAAGPNNSPAKIFLENGAVLSRRAGRVNFGQNDGKAAVAA
jgi:hypothetical protein